MYSCDIGCMSREIMKMDGRGSAKCQKSKSEDMIDIIEFDLMIIGQNSE